VPDERLKIAVALVAVLAVSGCGGAGGGETAGHRRRAPNHADRSERTPAEPLKPSHCPPELRSCRSAEGRIVYVERVDPDGDGDAHFVIRDPQGITLPGLTAIDVRKGLRPHPLPGPGDVVSAAGPVQTGSYGQHQIHALELHVALVPSRSK
jgi:hypothetical protein